MKQRPRVQPILRFAGRVTATLVGLLVFSLVSVQFARVVEANVALAHELSSTQDDVGALQVRREHQLREINRLESPDGAIPEIHDRLRLVGPREAIIFVSPAPSPAS
ncbi:MAG: hypothetical protein ABI282_07155 [Candidatus Baltobacteraceae bacterium]